MRGRALGLGLGLCLGLAPSGCTSGSSLDDSTPDPSGPGDQDELGSASDSGSSASSGSETDTLGSTSASTSSSSSEGESSETSSTSESSSTSETGDPPEFAFAAEQTSNVFAFVDLQLADLDADGCADLVLSGTGAPPRFNIYLGACDGSFPGPAITREVWQFDEFVLGDLDADARADIIARASGAPPRLAVYRVGDALALSSVIESEVWAYDRLWAGDVDGDGRVELITHQSDAFAPTLFTWSGSGDGNLAALAQSEVVGFEFAAIGRVDLDARSDLVLGSVSLGSQISWWQGQAEGTLVQTQPTQDLFEIGHMVLGDLDGDGHDELLANVPGNDWVVQIYANLGDAFAEDAQLFAAVGYTKLRSADLDGDGRSDLIVAPAGQPPRVTTWLSQ
jgi:hypothetical protein